MPAPPPTADVTIWTDARRAALVARVLAAMGPAVRATSVGGPRSNQVSELGQQLGCPAGDDLRKLLLERPAAFVFLATMDGVTREDIVATIAQEAVVLTLEPVAAALDELPPNTGRVILAPSLGLSPGWTSAAEPLEVLGGVRTIGLTSFGSPDECSLFARLYDAFGMIRTLVAMPETVDASLGPPRSAPPGAAPGAAQPQSPPPDDPRDMAGHLAVLARLPAGAAAVIQISDITGSTGRQLTIVGDHGRIRAGDLNYELTDHQGKPMDHHRPTMVGSGFVDLIVWQWSRLLQRTATTAAPPPNDAQVLACCLACLLSARTGQPESPAKLMSLQR